MVSMRVCVFETNSSSTHALLLCNDEIYRKLQVNDLFIDYAEEEFVTREEFEEAIRKAYKEGGYYPKDACPVDELENASIKELTRISDYMYLHIVPLDSFYGEEREYETAAGEIIHAFGLEWEDG